MTTRIELKAQRQTDRIGPDLLEKIIDGFETFPDAVQQIVENGVDYRANAVRIRFFSEAGNVPCVMFIDNGTGMGPEEREAYLSVCLSTSKDDVTKKGRNGTGRLGFFHHASVCYTVTKTADGKTFATSLYRDTLFQDLFTENGRYLEWEEITLPPGHPLKHVKSGTVVTWRDLRIGSRQALARRSFKQIVNHLAERLSPHIVRMVSVSTVDKQGKEHQSPLKPREIKGKKIDGSLSCGSPLGDVHYELYVVAKADAARDHVMMGAMGPVCTWAEFQMLFDDHDRLRYLAREIGKILGYLEVVGSIDIPMLNEFATNDRKRFSSKIIDAEGLCQLLLETLLKQIVPLVENELGMRSHEVVTSDDETFVSLVCGKLHEATGVLPKAEKIAHIETNRSLLKLKPGDQFVIRINNPESGATYQWDDTGSGGSVDKRRGTSVTYTARTLGTHTLVVSKLGPVDNTPRLEITIIIVESLPMCFAQPTVPMKPNDRRYIRLENVPKDARLTWTKPDGWNGAFNVEPSLTGAEVLSDKEKGDFDVFVHDENSEQEAHCTLRVSDHYGKKRAKTGSSVDDEFVIDGHRFRLTTTRIRGNSERSVTSWLQPGDTLSVITLNLAHPVFRPESDIARMIASLREIALRVVTPKPGDNTATFESVLGSANKVLATFMDPLLKEMT